MKITISLTAAAMVFALAAPSSLATAATGPKPKSPISNPFHEYGGIPGLKLGYGDVLAQCATYNNAANQNPYLPFVTNVNVIGSLGVAVKAEQTC